MDFHIGWLILIRDIILFLTALSRTPMRFEGLIRFVATSNHFNKVCYFVYCAGDRISNSIKLWYNPQSANRTVDTSRIFKLYVIPHFECNLSNVCPCEISRLHFVMHSLDIFMNNSFPARNIITVKKWVTCQSLLSIVSLPEIILPERLCWHKNGWTLVKYLRSSVCRLLKKSITEYSRSNIASRKALTICSVMCITHRVMLIKLERIALSTEMYRIYREIWHENKFKHETTQIDSYSWKVFPREIVSEQRGKLLLSLPLRRRRRAGWKGWKASIVRKTYKSLLSKHCSQKSALLGGRTRNAEVDMVLGSPPVAPMLPAFKAGELIPPPHLFRPPPLQMPSPTVDPMNSIKPPLESDIALYVPRSPHRRSHTRFLTPFTRSRSASVASPRSAATHPRSTFLHRVPTTCRRDSCPSAT